jgi:hypothetical protein
MTDRTKHKNSKGYYRDGHVTLRDSSVKTKTYLYAQVRVTSPELIRYIRDLCNGSDGALSASDVISALASLGYKQGLRLSDDIIVL